ncbi:hypothetical protein CASFOL_004721 [Castilleja foliolosa]|uniref:Rhodopsin n=1 Tax=Castilleja foliolosa TaxID=1961234 RepID=A0ABD3EBZ6_9LAMI
MSYYNNNNAPVGAPPPQGYPPEGYPKDAYPPQGYPPQGYPPQGYPQQYPPQYGQAPPPQQKQSGGFMEGWYFGCSVLLLSTGCMFLMQRRLGDS